jgi:hypothetical protein
MVGKSKLLELLFDLRCISIGADPKIAIIIPTQVGLDHLAEPMAKSHQPSYPR